MLLRQKRMVRPVAALLLSLSFLNGCFAYAPANGVAPRPGARVRVQLREPQVVKLGELTANDVVSLIGEVVTEDSSQIVLSALSATTRSGFEHAANGETVRVPRSNAAAVSVNRVSLVRTAGLAGLVALGGAAFVSGVRAGRASNGGGGSGGGNQQ
ncbi:MAG TPA: hypothetical protein VF647_03440 [Longimicrobium sp.]|jgi:hypothetical protein